MMKRRDAEAGLLAESDYRLEAKRLCEPVLHFWSPHLDPAHPHDCTQPERYVIQVQASGAFLAIAADGEALVEVADPESAHLFHAHEAALRAAKELNAEGRGPVDVVKLELDVS